MSRRARHPQACTRSPTPYLELGAPDLFKSPEALVALLVIAVSTVAVYSNTFGASFHFDDIPSIVQNDSLRHLRRQWPPSGNRFLGYLSFALNYRLGGLDVVGYHIANLSIHLCNGLFIFWLTTITLRTPALRHAKAGLLVRRHLPLASGLLFAVHPLATQAVTYIVQRFTSLATFFFLLSLALYAEARLFLERDRPPNAHAAGLYFLSFFTAAAAMKTKEISVTLPLVATVYEVLFFRLGRRMLLVVPLAVTTLLVPLGLATEGQKLSDVLADVSRFAAEVQEIPRSFYVLTQLRVIVKYLRLLLLPIGQNLDYDFRLSHSLVEAEVLFAITVLLSVVVSAVFLLVRARRANRAGGILVFFGVAWFFITLSVESSVIPIRDVIFEHRVYLPSAGAAVAIATILLCAVERLRLRISLTLQATLALLITAGPLGAATLARNVVWKDDLSLWSDVVAKSPRKARAHDNLGGAYWKNRQIDHMMREFSEAIRLDPDDAKAHGSLGVAYKEKGDVDNAMREFRYAIRLNSGEAEFHSNMGCMLKELGRTAEAVEELRIAFEIKPMPEITMNLAGALEMAGRGAEATAYYRRVLDDESDYPELAQIARGRIAILRASPEPNSR